MLAYFSAQMIERQRVALSKQKFSKVFCFSRVGRCWEAAGVRKSVRRRKSETTGRRSPPFLHLFLHLFSTFSLPWTNLRKDERHRFKWEQAKTQKEKICGNIGTSVVPGWKVEKYKYSEARDRNVQWNVGNRWNWLKKKDETSKC